MIGYVKCLIVMQWLSARLCASLATDFVQPHRLARSGWHTCREYGAEGCSSDGSPDGSHWPTQCCCPARRACFDETKGAKGLCTFCPSAFTKWRTTFAANAEATIISLLWAPRTLLIGAAVWPAIGWGDAPLAPALTELISKSRSTAGPELPLRWLGDRLPVMAARSYTKLDDAIQELRAPVYFLFPQLHVAWDLLPSAQDSFWWVLPIIFSLLTKCHTECSALVRVVLRRSSVLDECKQLLMSEAIGIGTAFLIWVVHNIFGFGGILASSGITLLIAWYATRAACGPALSLRAGRILGLIANIFVLVIAISFSQRPSMDWPTLLLMAGPLALLIQHYAVFAGFAHRASIQIDRSSFFLSSIEQLGRMDQEKLAFGPPLVAYTGPDGKAVPEEASVSLGDMLLPKSPWLEQVLIEFLNPANGLVAVVQVDAARFVRLKKGARLNQLEAFGKALGLAYRSGYELPTDLIPPIWCLLSNPRLAEILSSANLKGMSGGGVIDKPAVEELKVSADWAQWLEHSVLDDESARRHALKAFVVDVADELHAVWRGLWAVPGVATSTMSRKRRQNKLPNDQAQEEGACSPAKRRRIVGSDPSQD